MPSRLLLGCALVCAVTALAFTTPPSGLAPLSETAPLASVTIAKSTHTVRVEYRARRGALRQARVTILPKERGARADWERGLEAVFFTAPDATPGLDRYTPADRIIEVEREGSGYVGTGIVPAPEYLRTFFLRSGGSTTGFTVQDSPNDGDDPPREDPPKEPPSEDPPAEDPPEDDDDCSCAGCMEICNPWTCECDEPNPFPEREGYQSDESGFSFGI